MRIRSIKYRSKEWEQARKLRYELFFKEHSLDPSIMDDEYEAVSCHIGIFQKERLVAYGRLTKKENGSFMISQTVVQPSSQSNGLGRIIVNYMLQLVGDSDVWLNARLVAVGFYSKLGFQVIGNEFVTPNTGVKHIKMVRYC